MKELMLGNKAVARGLYEAGCKVISSYPGTPSTEITEEAAAYNEIYCEWAPNEKVALEVAHGATLGGVRSACAMKHVGLNVAADPLFTISYQGLNAGLVVCVADDPGMHSSQNEQDSRHYAIAAKLPMLEPSDSEESRVFAKKAFEMSEKFNTPVLLKMVTRVAHSQSVVDTEERVEPDRVPYVKDPAKVMMTLNSRNAHIRVEERTKALIEYAESTELNRVEMGEDTSVGIITDSTSYQYAREVLGDKASILKLGMINPLPEKLIKDFAQKVDKVIVLEELDPIIENHCKQLGIKVAGKDTFPICGEFSQNLVRKCLGMKEPEHITIEENVPARPPVMCAGCPHGGFVDEMLNERLLSVLSTKENVNLSTLGFTIENVKKFQALIAPVEIAGERLGTLFMYKSDSSYEIDDIILSEYGTTVVGLEMMRSVNEETAEESRKKKIVRSAIDTLSTSELDAIKSIFKELDGNEGTLVASKIADNVGITRSVIVNALRKFESAGVIDCKSSGMKGTYIKVVNEYVFEELSKLDD